MEKKTATGIFALAIIALLGASGFVAAAGGFGFLNAFGEDQAAMQAQHEAMQEAVSNGDFATWKTLQEQRIADMQAQITEENFNKLVERHNQMSEIRDEMQKARESGDFSKVRELQEQYGLGRGNFGMKQMKHFAN